jgi:hypothetical protein
MEYYYSSNTIVVLKKLHSCKFVYFFENLVFKLPIILKVNCTRQLHDNNKTTNVQQW